MGVLEDQEIAEEKGKAEAEAQKAKETYINVCVTDVMRNQSGRHFIWWFLEQCGIYTDGFDESPTVHAHRAGLRSAGLLLLSKILQECPSYYNLMFAEHKYEEEKKNE